MTNEIHSAEAFTIDRAGRSRAPAGGCMCLGVRYEGGEFLPESMDSIGGGDRAPVMSPRQIEAAAAREERLAGDRAHSGHVGKVGERITVILTVAAVLTFDGFYGPTYLTIARDENGNVFVSKGARWAAKDTVARVKASVKEHGERDGVKQTVLQRVKVECVWEREFER